jgi:hypothetical protein
MFFRGSLDKLGIYPDIYQIGKYKSAGDMFHAEADDRGASAVR